MLSFKTFFVEGVYKLTDNERHKVNEIVDRYFMYFGPDKLKGILRTKKPENVYKKDLNQDGEFFLGSMEYVDLEHPDEKKTLHVDVSFDRNARQRADYNHEDQKITLYYYVIGNSSRGEIRSSTEHELLHAKQQYKKFGKEYRYAVRKRTETDGYPGLRSRRGYYFHPTEFPVHVTVIIDELQQHFLDFVERVSNAREQGKDAEAKFWQKRKDQLLQFLETFIRSGGRVESLPDFLERDEDFINILSRNRNNPKYKKFFKAFYKSVYSIYKQLKDYDER